MEKETKKEHAERHIKTLTKLIIERAGDPMVPQWKKYRKMYEKQLE